MSCWRQCVHRWRQAVVARCAKKDLLFSVRAAGSSTRPGMDFASVLVERGGDVPLVTDVKKRAMTPDEITSDGLSSF